MLNNEDFELNGNILVRYNGNDKDIIIPYGVKVIGDQAFYENQIIESVKFPEGVTKIGASAFMYCENLREIQLPGTIETIGNKSFADCPLLMAVNIPDGVKIIEHHAFFNCGLKTVIIPESLDTLGVLAFGGFNPIENINVATGNKRFISVDGVIYNKSMEKLFMFPQNKQTDTFVIPNGVKVIYSLAFAGVADINVVIPESVTEIMEEAFLGSVSIGDIYIPETTVSIGKNAFNGCLKSTIHGKAGSEAEKAAKRENIPFSTEWNINLA